MLGQNWIDGDAIDATLIQFLQLLKVNNVMVIPNWQPAKAEVVAAANVKQAETAQYFLHAFHVKQQHWIGIIYCRQKKSFIVYDSLDNYSPIEKFYDYILTFAWILQNNLKVSLLFNVNLLVSCIVTADKIPCSNTDLFQ